MMMSACKDGSRQILSGLCNALQSARPYHSNKDTREANKPANTVDVTEIPEDKAWKLE